MCEGQAGLRGSTGPGYFQNTLFCTYSFVSVRQLPHNPWSPPELWSSSAVGQQAHTVTPQLGRGAGEVGVALKGHGTLD